MQIVACLIVKNEEELLPQCLESIQPLVDRIVVCDTGSTDKSIEIAKKFNAEVYHHPWQNDFSLHRNQSISYADADDFVLIIDADEKLEYRPGFTKKHLKDWLEKVGVTYSAIAVTVNDIQKDTVVMNCNSARIFRKNDIIYKNKVHNAPIFTGSAVLCNELVIKHFGYDLSPEKMKSKLDRTYNLLLQDLEDIDEEGFPKRCDTYFYLCQLLGHHKRTQESIEWGYKYLSIKDKVPIGKFNKTIYFTMIKSLHSSGLMEEAFKIIIEALKETPYDPDVSHALSDHGAMIGNHSMMADGARRFIKGYKMMMEQPNLKAGQFYFSLNEGSVTLMLYRIHIVTMQEAMRTWKALKPRLNKVNKEMLNELKTNLERLGQSHLLEEIENLYDTKKQDTYYLPPIGSINPKQSDSFINDNKYKLKEALA